jgi:hypothetical protein
MTSKKLLILACCNLTPSQKTMEINVEQNIKKARRITWAQWARPRNLLTTF